MPGAEGLRNILDNFQKKKYVHHSTHLLLFWLVSGFVEAVPEVVPEVVEAVPEIVPKVVDAVLELLPLRQ